MFNFSAQKRKARAGRNISSLGTLLVELGYCSRDEVESIAQDTAPTKLGQRLVAKGVITQEQLDQALLRQGVLRGHAEAAELRIYGAGRRRKALKDITDRIKGIAESAGQMAKQVHEG
jgi:hypothetical protein